ncbi:MAG: ATP-dependent Zn protease [Gemmatimonadaceae bacterium]|nr:ATP-dependent Zn protease [Gloeobacterales cyanobacterium ES-bin-141]
MHQGIDILDTTGLLAVLVFLFTMLAGVGPLLGLSPTVAAFAAIGLMGFLLLDQFVWQGRLGSLVLGTLQEHQSGWRERVAVHEAGHLLVAYRLGIVVEDYTIGAWETFRKGYPGGGGVVFAPPVGTQLSLAQVEAYCATWLAGGVAESLHYQKVLGGADDRQKVQALLSTVQRASRTPIQPRTLYNRAGRTASAILQAESETHQSLGQSMLRGTDIKECLRQLDPGNRPT